MTPKTLTRKEIETFRDERDLALAGLEAGEREKLDATLPRCPVCGGADGLSAPLAKCCGKKQEHCTCWMFERTSPSPMQHKQIATDLPSETNLPLPSPGAREERMTPEKAVDQFVEGFSRDYKAAIAEHKPPSPSVEELAERLSEDACSAGACYAKRAAPHGLSLMRWQEDMADAAAAITRLQAELSRKDEEIESLLARPDNLVNASLRQLLVNTERMMLTMAERDPHGKIYSSELTRAAENTANLILGTAIEASTKREAALREALAEMVQQFKGQLRRDAWEFEIGFDAAKEAIKKARAALDRGEG